MRQDTGGYHEARGEAEDTGGGSGSGDAGGEAGYGVSAGEIGRYRTVTDIRCTESAADGKKKMGRPVDPNAKKKATVCLRPDDWDYLKQWQSENEAETNYSIAIERMVEFMREFAPGGPMVEKPRDSQGRFLPGNGTSKMAICRRKRRERREKAVSE